MSGALGCPQTVHFIRHAEGFHNIGWEDNTDAHLTIRGWQQAAALQHHINATLKPPLDVEVRCAYRCSSVSAAALMLRTAKQQFNVSHTLV